MATSLLLADDSPTIAKILSMALQAEPYQIRSVLTAAEAIKELRENPPFFFLVDLNLPEKNGYEFARWIKSESKLSKTKVILLSSAFEPVDDAEFQSCGADGVISKPFDPSDLRAKLKEVLDAPPKFPSGTKVQGALSGTQVTAQTNTMPTNEVKPSGAPDPSLLMDLPSGAIGGADADSILSSLMAGSGAENPPPFASAPPANPPKERREFTNSTVMLDLSNPEAPPKFQPEEQVLDLSAGFETPSGTISAASVKPAPIDLSSAGSLDLPPLNESSGDLPPSSPPPSTNPADEPLSANAQALAAFFEAELGSNPNLSLGMSRQEDAPPAPPTPEEPEEDSFDASLSSIDWSSSADKDLSGWSTKPMKEAASTSPEKQSLSAAPVRGPLGQEPEPIIAPSMAAPLTFDLPIDESPGLPMSAPTRPDPAKKPAPAKQSFAGASSGGSFLFDTGGSNFRFADDYVRRITKAFTGAQDEHLPKQAGTKPEPMFPTASHDSAPTTSESMKSLRSGGGAWTPEELQKIEQLVKEEVQMVVREVAEKIAWEVIPELAENLIKKELEKVLKQMEE